MGRHGSYFGVGPAGEAAGYAPTAKPRSPGIEGWAKIGSPHGKFVKIVLSDDDGATLLQAADHGGIRVRNPVREYRACRRGSNAGGVYDVLE